VWEYSSSLSARLAQISYDFGNDIANVESEEDVQSALDSAAEAVKEIAEEKREGASNIEDGFGHETSASTELAEIADSLEEWADEISSADIPELPEPEDEDCDECDGTGKVENPEYDREIGEEDGEHYDPAYLEEEEIECEACEGTGTITPEEPTEDQMSQWRDDVVDACSIVDESPV
jgi:RecJ-like exonuclease